MRTRDEAFRITCTLTTQRVFGILGILGMPMPEFYTMTRTGSRRQGVCYYHPNWPTCVIKVQARMARDERNLQRIVAHEVLHHVLYMRHGVTAQIIGHGGLFLDLMHKVNEVLGENFVTVDIADDYAQPPLTRPVTLVMWLWQGKAEPFCAWYVKGTPKTDRMLGRMLAHPKTAEVRVIKTRDARLTQTPRLASYQSARVAGEVGEEVLRLWASAQPLATTAGAQAAA